MPNDTVPAAETGLPNSKMPEKSVFRGAEADGRRGRSEVAGSDEAEPQPPAKPIFDGAGIYAIAGGPDGTFIASVRPYRDPTWPDSFRAWVEVLDHDGQPWWRCPQQTFERSVIRKLGSADEGAGK
jgi:hypothetical protein